MSIEEKRWPKIALTYTPQKRRRKGRLTDVYKRQILGTGYSRREEEETLVNGLKGGGG